MQEFQSKKNFSANKFESVTIFYSDIADFHIMVKENTPTEVKWQLTISIYKADN